MKRLLILSMLAILTVGASGCCRLGWWRHRGLPCNSCETGGCETGAIYGEGELIVPPQPGAALRPGPAVTTPGG